MANVLSIQSHVSYGYVGNKSVSFPLQSLGLDVWTVNTVQFSNHTGYGRWRGQVCSAHHVAEVIRGLEEQGLAQQCNSILSEYIGDTSIGQVIVNTVKRFKTHNPDLVYLFDPVMGGNSNGKKCFVKKDIPHFFKESFPIADIITPNHYEAEILYGKEIDDIAALKNATNFFHEQGVQTVIVRNLEWNKMQLNKHYHFLSDQKSNGCWLAESPNAPSEMPINGSGDLFSALYLGLSLLGSSPLESFQYALNKTHEIIIETIMSQKRELKIIGHNYAKPPKPLARIKSM